MILFQSCNNDDIPIEDIETFISYNIYCDDQNAQMLIYANGLDSYGLYAKDSFRHELKTKDFFAYI